VDACGPDETAFRYVTVVTSSVTSSSSSSSDRAGERHVTAQQTHRCLARFAGRSAIPGTSFTYLITAVGPASDPAHDPGPAPDPAPASSHQFYCWLVVESPLQQHPALHLSFAAECRHGARGIQLDDHYLAHYDILPSPSSAGAAAGAGEPQGGWMRNCSSRHEVPVLTPGPRQRPSTPGLATTARRPTTNPPAESRARRPSRDLGAAAAAAAAAGLALIVNVFYVAAAR